MNAQIKGGNWEWIGDFRCIPTGTFQIDWFRESQVSITYTYLTPGRYAGFVKRPKVEKRRVEIGGAMHIYQVIDRRREG